MPNTFAPFTLLSLILVIIVLLVACVVFIVRLLKFPINTMKMASLSKVVLLIIVVIGHLLVSYLMMALVIGLKFLVASMCYYLAFNSLCGVSGMRCPFEFVQNKWAISCPKYRQWLGSLGLGSYCEPPVPNSAPIPREFELNEWERTQYKPAPF